ncbi:dUTP diphosphatase [Parafannyhessea umbonata]|uniref:dUTP diphosphatase n=1 Tax=Parafannyhessea umbonata TaxID=604330 RepID=A0A1H1L3K4_9ACTN|nr:dUTP diphosphatase [Parafannyhessea umbonata]SDR68900.1 dUTP pyrophosphatase [Parafannyhessea umbonata]
MERINVAVEAGCKVPRRGDDDSAGLDLSVSKDVSIPASGHKMCHTGVHVQIPKNHVGLVFIRSSVGAKRHVELSNGVGVIDCGYTGEVMLPLHNHGNSAQFFRAGERVAQLVIVPCVMTDVNIVDELDETSRGDGGFGSTGKD